MTRSLVVKATAGADDPERCVQALSVAAAACTAGVPTSLWLSGEAVWLAAPGRGAEIALPLAPDLAEIVDLLIEEGSVTVCTQCAARRELTATDLLPGVAVAGAGTFVAEAVAEGAQALVY